MFHLNCQYFMLNRRYVSLRACMADQTFSSDSRLYILQVVGDKTPALESVLECDVRRTNLIKEEKTLTAKLQSNR